MPLDATGLARQLDRLAAAELWTYRASRWSKSEPAAWSALALAAHGRRDQALRAADWLAQLQHSDGSVSVGEDDGDAVDDLKPRWPTALAIWAWAACDRGVDSRFGEAIDRACKWALLARGETAPRSPQIGHDTTLVGWTWAAKTHSWLEPTAMFVLGLRAAGLANHPRVLEGEELLRDRLLPEGGANYGNTFVLGQELVPHVQPTGLAMLALAGSMTTGDELGNVNPFAPNARIENSLRYLERSLVPELAPDSLGYALMGLTSHGRRPASAERLIQARLTLESADLAPYDQALLLAAAASERDALAFTPARVLS